MLSLSHRGGSRAPGRVGERDDSVRRQAHAFAGRVTCCWPAERGRARCVGGTPLHPLSPVRGEGGGVALPRAAACSSLRLRQFPPSPPHIPIHPLPPPLPPPPSLPPPPPSLVRQEGVHRRCAGGCEARAAAAPARAAAASAGAAGCGRCAGECGRVRPLPLNRRVGAAAVPAVAARRRPARRPRSTRVRVPSRRVRARRIPPSGRPASIRGPPRRTPCSVP